LPARLDRAESSRARLRRERLAQERRLTEAATELSTVDIAEAVLDDNQTAVLLRLLDLALAARTPGAPRAVAAAAHGVRLVLIPAAGYTTVTSKRGTLHIDGFRLQIEPAGHTSAVTGAPR
ncbi:MAG: DUF2397 family protein, partial [Micromonosporaceae bacterium]|nr:DUF2397 family protein [Micromonosporaceae bacterium]